MRKLLHADLFALLHSRVFRVELIATALFSAYIVIANYSTSVQASSDPIRLDDVFFILYQLIGVLIAAGVSLIVGAEYSDGTLRNKLIAGHTRAAIYGAALLSNLIAVLPVLAAHAAVSVLLGYVLLGACQMPIAQFLTMIALAALSTLAFTAIFVAVSMNCANRAFGAVAALLLALGLTLCVSTVGNQLSEPETTYDGITITMDGIEFGDLIDNPAYVSGRARTALELVYDLLPAGQLIQLQQRELTRAARFPAFSALFFALCTACGYVLFRRKDLK